MDDADALLAAIDADPAADLPRLIWADYLDDTGHPVPAEFVRMSCLLARKCPERTPEERRSQRNRWLELYDLYAAAYFPPSIGVSVAGTRHDRATNTSTLQQRVECRGHRLCITEHERGIPGMVDMPLPDFALQASGWWPGLPVRELCLVFLWAGEHQTLVRSPILPRLTTLALGQYSVTSSGYSYQDPPVHDDIIRGLAECNGLSTLTRFVVTETSPRRSTVEALLDSTWLRRIDGSRFHFELRVRSGTSQYTGRGDEMATDVLRRLLADHGDSLPADSRSPRPTDRHS